MRGAVELDDDGEAQLVRRTRGVVGQGRAAARGERHPVALEDERRLVLGERARREEVAHVEPVAVPS